jgi:hypothetical protein
MLARYKIYRGRRPPDDPLPAGVRVDTRRHTRHVLRPPRDLVDAYLDGSAPIEWNEFAAAYRGVIAERFDEDPSVFRALAEQAMTEDVYIGCSCPTQKNPDVRNCHTWLALEFMKERFPDIEIVLPG